MKTNLLPMIFFAAVAAAPPGAPAATAESDGAAIAASAATDSSAARSSTNRDDFLLRKKIETPSMSDLLTTIVLRLPGDSTLERLNVGDDNQLELQGLAVDTAQLVDTLKQSGLLAAPTVSGTHQVDPRTKKERFHIVAHLRTGSDSHTRPSPAFLVAADSDSAIPEMTKRLEQAIQGRAQAQPNCSVLGKTAYNNGMRERHPRVAIQIRMQCGSATFAEIVRDLEEGSPDLFVGQLMLYRQQGVDDPVRGEARPSMNIRFDLSGYLRPRP